MKIFKLDKFKELGFTMIEILVYTALAALILTSVTKLTFKILEYKAEDQRITMTYQEAQRAFEKIIYDVRRGDGYLIDSGDSSRVDLYHDGFTTTVFLQDGQIYVLENGNTETLTTDVVNISKLEFDDWTSPNAQNLLHITLDIELFNKTESFETSVHARSPY